MKKVLVLVEGQTEEFFIKKILSHHLEKKNIFITPTILATKRVKSGPDFKGGIISYTRVKRELIRLLGDTSAGLVTTMFDMNGLPHDFPGKSDASGTPLKRVKYIEQVFDGDINDSRFLSYISLHEFESLLFSYPHEIAKSLNTDFHEPFYHQN